MHVSLKEQLKQTARDKMTYKTWISCLLVLELEIKEAGSMGPSEVDVGRIHYRPEVCAWYMYVQQVSCSMSVLSPNFPNQEKRSP